MQRSSNNTAVNDAPAIDLDACLADAREAALLAWEAIRPFHRGKFDIYEKPGEGPATDADIAADRAILKHLGGRYDPDVFSYLTEESIANDARFSRPYCWIIDPIDGTRDFIAGGTDFVVHVGLAGPTGTDGKNGAIAGVVFHPATGEMFMARRGGGAFVESADGKNRRPLRASDLSTPGDATLVITSSHVGNRLSGFIDRMQFGTVYGRGSLGLKMMEVAKGNADVYVNLGRRMCKEWDVCAPHAILEEAGGRVTDTLGKEVSYVHRDYCVEHGLIASNGQIHAQTLATIADREP